MPQTINIGRCITILTGPNSSGKSSLIDLLLSLEKSSNTRNNDDFLDYINFFRNDTINLEVKSVLNNPEKPFILGYNFSIYDNNLYYFNPCKIVFTIKCKYKIYNDTTLKLESVSLITRNVEVLFIEWSQFKIEKIEVNLGAFCEFLIEEFNNEEYRLKSKFDETYLEELDRKHDMELVKIYQEYLTSSLYFNEFIPSGEKKISNKIRNIVLSTTELDSIYLTSFRDLRNNNAENNIYEDYGYDIFKHVLDNFRESFDLFIKDKILFFINSEERTKIMSYTNEDDFKDYSCHYSSDEINIGSILHSYMSYATKKIDLFNSMEITKIPIMKYYRENVLNIYDDNFLSKVIRMGLTNNHINTEFEEKWLKKFGIGNKIIVSVWKNKFANIEIETFDNKLINLDDLGFGAGQIISLILLTRINNLKGALDYYIEEPETNLHPNWQSLVIELIFEINIINTIDFVIETHSEYIIRKIQSMVASRKAFHDIFAIYYFRGYDDKKKNPNIPAAYEIKIREDGFLENDFGPGFLDEANFLSLSLLNSQN